MQNLTIHAKFCSRKRERERESEKEKKRERYAADLIIAKLCYMHKISLKKERERKREREMPWLGRLHISLSLFL